MAFYLGSNKIASGGNGTTGTASETPIDLQLNYLTEEQYQTAKVNGEISEDQLYFTPDDSNKTPVDKNIDNWKGNFFCWLGALSDYTGLPVGHDASYGYLECYSSNTEAQRKMVFTTFNSAGASKVYFRFYTNSRWYAWQQL